MKDILETNSAYLLVLLPLVFLGVIIAAHYMWDAWKEFKKDDKDDDRS